jgi:hypothetical protein
LPAVEELNVQMDVLKGVVEFRDILGQRTVRPVGGVDRAVNDMEASKPLVPFARILSLAVEPAVKLTFVEDRVRLKLGGGVTTRKAATRWNSPPLRPFTTTA